MRGFFDPLGAIHKAVGIGLIIAMAGFAAWAFRADSLRAEHLATLNSITGALETALKMEPGTLPASHATLAVSKLDNSVKEWNGRYLRVKLERDTARGQIRDQNDSIRRYEAETKRLRALGEAQRKQAEELIAQRDHWIEEARKAATRTERAECERELAETEAVLDALYEADF